MNKTLPTLDTFLNDLVKEKQGEATLSPETRDEMKAELLPRLHKFIVLKTMTHLAQISPTDLAEFQALVDRHADPHEVQTYVVAKIPNGVVFLTDILIQFREIYLRSNPVR